jgi:hypothetical protein
LLYPGGANGTIGGYGTNDHSRRNQWALTNVGSGPTYVPQFDIINQDITTFAAIFQTGVNETLVGNPTQNITWYVLAASDAVNEYSLSHIWHFASYGWTLPDGNDGTGITVSLIGDAPAKNQLWKLVPVPN